MSFRAQHQNYYFFILDPQSGKLTPDQHFCSQVHQTKLLNVCSGYNFMVLLNAEFCDNRLHAVFTGSAQNLCWLFKQQFLSFTKYMHTSRKSLLNLNLRNAQNLSTKLSAKISTDF